MQQEEEELEGKKGDEVHESHEVMFATTHAMKAFNFDYTSQPADHLSKNVLLL